MKQKIKDVIADGRWNWFGLANEEEDSQDNCYKGLFWDLEPESSLDGTNLKRSANQLKAVTDSVCVVCIVGWIYLVVSGYYYFF